MKQNKHDKEMPRTTLNATKKINNQNEKKTVKHFLYGKKEEAKC